MEDESFEQEGPLGEGLGEAEVEHKVEEEASVAETLSMGTQAAWATMMLNHSVTWDAVNLGESEPRESIPLRELDAHFP